MKEEKLKKFKKETIKAMKNIEDMLTNLGKKKGKKKNDKTI